MKNIFILLFCLVSLYVKAQDVVLPPDEVTVVEHVMQEGETLITIWEDYGQKFKLKEYNKYNTAKFTTPGTVLYVPVHTTAKEFLTKGQYNHVLAKYSTSTVSSTAPAGSQAEATITKMKLSPFNGEEFKMFLDIKADVKWLAQKTLGYRYIYYDGSHKEELYRHGFTLIPKKDDYKLSQTDDVRYEELPHKDGANEYAVVLEVYNPQDNDKVMARSGFLDFSLTWDGKKVRTTHATGADKVLNLLNDLKDVVATVTPVKKEEMQTVMAGGGQTASAAQGYEEDPQMTDDALSVLDGNNTYYGSDPELEYAMTHTNNPEANDIMGRLLNSFHAKTDYIAKSNAIYEEARQKHLALYREVGVLDKNNNLVANSAQRKTTGTTQRRGTATAQRSTKVVRRKGGSVVVGNSESARHKEIDNWRDSEVKRLKAGLLDSNVEDDLADRYCALLGIRQIGRSNIGCAYCKGTSICHSCNGGGAGVKTNAAGLKEKCRDCHGTGKCSRCKSGSRSFFNHMPDPDHARQVLLGKKAAKKYEKQNADRVRYSETDVLCGYCRGSRKCYHCNGKGVVNQGSVTEHQCTVCRGKNNAQCTYCDGTGKMTRTTTSR